MQLQGFAGATYCLMGCILYYIYSYTMIIFILESHVGKMTDSIVSLGIFFLYD